MEERWIKLEGYNGMYSVSSLGSVKSYYKTKSYPFILLKKTIRNGYYSVGLSINGLEKRVNVHRLVACNFIPSSKEQTQVNHIDGNKLNNNVENLEWCTSKENVNHAHKMGLVNTPYGEMHANSKLNVKSVLEIRSKYIKRVKTYKSLALEYGVSKATITEIINRQIWKHI